MSNNNNNNNNSSSSSNKKVVKKKKAKGSPFLSHATLQQRFTRRERLRLGVEAEIVATEQAYVQSLQTIVSVFMEPLAAKNNAIISKEKQTQLFSNIAQLCTLHTQFVKELVRAHDAGLSLAGPFKMFTPHFKIYTDYVNKYGISATLCSEKLYSGKRKYSPFINWVNTVEQSPECKGQNLRSLMIMPIQRLPRYKLLLAELCKRTLTESPDYTDLLKVLEEVGEVAGFVNEAKRKEEGFSETRLLSQQLGKEVCTSIALLQPNRYFIKRGHVMVGSLSTGKAAARACDVVLFNDLLLVVAATSKISKGITSYDLVSTIKIDSKVTLGLPSVTETAAVDAHFIIYKQRNTSSNASARRRGRLSVMLRKDEVKALYSNNNNNSPVKTKISSPPPFTPPTATSTATTTAIAAADVSTSSPSKSSSSALSNRTKDLVVWTNEPLTVLEWVDAFTLHCFKTWRDMVLVRAVAESDDGARYAQRLLEDVTVSVDVNTPHPVSGDTLLMSLVQRGLTDAIDTLLEPRLHCNVNLFNEHTKESPLLRAAKAGRRDIVELLCAQETMNFAYTDGENKTVFHYAPWLLERKQSNIGYTVLGKHILAADTSDCVQLVRTLVELARARVCNEWTYNLNTMTTASLALTSTGSHAAEIVQILWGHESQRTGAHVTQPCGRYKLSPLMIAAAETGTIGQNSYLTYLLQHCAPDVQLVLHSQDKLLNTTLMHAVMSTNYTNAHVLLDYFVEHCTDTKSISEAVNTANKDQCTPLLMAVRNGAPVKLVRRLVEDFAGEIQRVDKKQHDCIWYASKQKTTSEVATYLKSLPQYSSNKNNNNNNNNNTSNVNTAVAAAAPVVITTTATTTTTTTTTTASGVDEVVSTEAVQIEAAAAAADQATSSSSDTSTTTTATTASDRPCVIM